MIDKTQFVVLVEFRGQNIGSPQYFGRFIGKFRQLPHISDTFPSSRPQSLKKSPAGTPPAGLFKSLFSNIKPEQDHIPVLDDIFFSLDPDKTLLAGRRQRSELQEHLVVDDFGLDEAALEVRVDLSHPLPL